MARLDFGVRIGRQGKLALGTSAFIFREKDSRFFLTRRSDNNRWCLPGGRVEPGESVSEACVREVFEESGLEVDITSLIGVYSDPHVLVTYADGNSFHFVVLHFAAQIREGKERLSDETTEFGWFTFEESAELDLMEHHRQRITDSLCGSETSFIR